MRKKRWSSRLARAVKRGCFTRKDEELAENWTTCAVGERFGDLPDGDTELERIGMRFYRAVHRNQVAAAVKAYGEIQDLRRAHACTTYNPATGECDGCFVSDALRAACPEDSR